MKLNWLKTLLALGLLAALVLTSCATPPATTTQPTSTPTTTPPTGTTPTTTTAIPAGPTGQFTMATGTFGNEKWDPILSDATHKGHGIAPMMDPLFWSEDNKIQPGLVEKWEMAPDGLFWTFNIRQGVKFHNGEDLKADDVKYSMDREMSPPSYNALLRTMTERVEVVDDYTVRIYTKGAQPYLPFMLTIYAPQQGFVQPKDYSEQNGMEVFQRKPVGSGAYKPVRIVAGDMVEYEAYDNYWRGAPAFKRFIRILVPEEVSRVAMLKTGAADVVEIGIESSIELESAGMRTFVSDYIQPVVQLHAAYDARAKGMPITDLRVRKALSLGINREEINTTFFFGKVGPIMPGYALGIADLDHDYWQKYAAEAYRYNPEEAKNLLKEAGYANGFNLKFYTWRPSGAPWMPKLGEILQGYWSRLGIKAEIVPIEQGTYTSWRRGPAEPLVGTATLFRRNSEAVTLRGLDSGFSNTGVNTLFGINTPESNEIDKLIRAAFSELDSAKRQELVAQVVKMATDSYIAISVASAATVFAVGDKMDLGFPTPTDSPYLPTYSGMFKHRK